MPIVNQKLQEINPLEVGEQYCEPLHSYGPASRSYWLLHYVVSGRGYFTSHGVTHTVDAGQCFVIRPYEITVYEADETHPWHYIWVGFDCGVPLPVILQNDVIDAVRFGQIFTDVLTAKQMNAGREAFLCAKIWELIARMTASEQPQKSTAAHYVEMAKTCIETEYSRGITVAEIARRLNLDRSYFSTLFKKHTGKSPQQYLNDYRLQQAAELLTLHGYSPSIAASSTGYADIFLFSRMFKRHFGVSPTQYVTQYRQENADR